MIDRLATTVYDNTNRGTDIALLIFKIVIIGLLLLSISNAAQGQTPAGKVTVDVEDLTPQQLKDAMTKRSLESRVDKWTSIGKGIGTATKEGLSAITEETNKFADTKVGMFTMLMIAYKIIGKDLIQLIIGAPLLIACTVVFIWIVRRNYVVRHVLERKDPDGTRHYSTYEPEEAYYIAVATGIYLLSVLMCILIIFA